MSATIDASTLLSNPAFSGDAITPSHPDYSQAIARWSLTGVRQAAVVIYPKDSQSTSAAVLWATSQGTPLAVKCGGNSVSGASSIDGGVVIDLEKYINSVVVNTDTKTVALGGGARWAKVDEETMKYGLATVRFIAYRSPHEPLNSSEGCTPKRNRW
jgi:FAD/FMN-containing dehydrogenase